MAKTFVFRSGSVDNGTLDDGLAGIFNNSTDPRAIIDIRRVRLLAVSGQSITGSGTLTVDRISALSGGEDVTPSKHDTNSADLPAEVLIRSIPDSVTITDAFRRFGDCPTFNSILAGSCFGRVQSASTGSARTQRDDIFRFPTSSSVERVILREGEGLAICEDVFSVPHAGAAGFCVRETTSGACYNIRSRDVRRRGAPDLAHIAIFNGTGSGVVLEIFHVQYPEEGEAIIPTIRIAKVSGQEDGVDATSSILQFDTEVPVPSEISAVVGPFRAKLAGEDNGVVIDWHTRHGIDGHSIAKQQDIGVFRRMTYPVPSTDAGSALLYSIASSLIWQAGGDMGIKIRPGEGFALLAGRAGVLDNSTMNCYQVEIMFNYLQPQVTKRSSINLGV